MGQCIARPYRRSVWARWSTRSHSLLSQSHWILCGWMPCSSHLVCFTAKTLEPLCCVGMAPGDTFTEHLGARCISGTRSHKCCQLSFTTPQLGIACGVIDLQVEKLPLFTFAGCFLHSPWNSR